MALYGQPCRFLYGNIVGRLIALNRVLGRNARFYNPAEVVYIFDSIFNKKQKTKKKT